MDTPPFFRAPAFGDGNGKRERERETMREKTLQFVPLNCSFLVMRQFWINMDRPNCTQNALCVVYHIANYKLELPINQVYPLTPRMDQL